MIRGLKIELAAVVFGKHQNQLAEWAGDYSRNSDVQLMKTRKTISQGLYPTYADSP